MPPLPLALVAFFLVASFAAGAVGGVAALLALRARERRRFPLIRLDAVPSGELLRVGDAIDARSGIVTREVIDEEHPAIRAFADAKPAAEALPTTPEREARLERSRHGETTRISAGEMRARLEARERRLFADEDELDLGGRR